MAFKKLRFNINWDLNWIVFQNFWTQNWTFISFYIIISKLNYFFIEFVLHSCFFFFILYNFTLLNTRRRKSLKMWGASRNVMPFVRTGKSKGRGGSYPLAPPPPSSTGPEILRFTTDKYWWNPQLVRFLVFVLSRDVLLLFGFFGRGGGAITPLAPLAPPALKYSGLPPISTDGIHSSLSFLF